jgi:hypothetical protein
VYTGGHTDVYRRVRFTIEDALSERGAMLGDIRRSRGSGREKVASIHSQVLSEALQRSQQEFFHRVSYRPGHSVTKPADRIVSEILVEYVQIF